MKILTKNSQGLIALSSSRASSQGSLFFISYYFCNIAEGGLLWM